MTPRRRALFIGGPWDGLVDDAPTDSGGRLSDEFVVILPARPSVVLTVDELAEAPAMHPTYRYRASHWSTVMVMAEGPPVRYDRVPVLLYVTTDA